jgi:AP-4 complex subunit mu-1
LTTCHHLLYAHKTRENQFFTSGRIGLGDNELFSSSLLEKETRATAMATSTTTRFSAKSHNNENAISSIFIVAPRGDVIIKREYRKDVPENQAEIFFRLVKFWGANERNRNEDGGNGGVIIGKENENEINGVGEGGGGTMDHSAPAAFNDQGVNYLHVKANGVYVVATTRANCSPSFVLELLHRIAKVIKDYCGTLSEDAVRKNAILTYELLDEMVDYGIPQSTSTAALEKHIFNDPVVVSESTSALGALGTTGRLAIQKTLDMRTGIDGVDRAIGTAKTAVIDGQKSQTYKKAAGAFDKILSSKISKNLMSKVDDVLAKGGSNSGGGQSNRDSGRDVRVSSSTVPGSATNVSVADDGAGEAIFVDVIDKLNVVYGRDGELVNADIDGCVKVRNFLRAAKDTRVRVAMPEDLEIGGRERANRRATSSGFGTNIDDCNFHETCDLSSWDENRTVSLLQPPRGEFNLMNYRMSASDFTPPFKVQCIIDDSTPFQIKIEIIVYCDWRSDVRSSATEFSFPLPKATQNATFTYDQNEAIGGGQTESNERATSENQQQQQRTHHAMYDQTRRCVTWQHKSLKGQTQTSLLVHASLNQRKVGFETRREIGPISAQFSIPSLNLSGMNVRYLRVSTAETGGASDKSVQRWVRYNAKSNNYICRV